MGGGDTPTCTPTCILVPGLAEPRSSGKVLCFER
eukprot:SAG22_NODE_25573_length_101_cov_53.000000_1_plen_33_part_11